MDLLNKQITSYVIKKKGTFSKEATIEDQDGNSIGKLTWTPFHKEKTFYDEKDNFVIKATKAVGISNIVGYVSEIYQIVDRAGKPLWNLKRNPQHEKIFVDTCFLEGMNGELIFSVDVPQTTDIPYDIMNDKADTVGKIIKKGKGIGFLLKPKETWELKIEDFSVDKKALLAFFICIHESKAVRYEDSYSA